MLALAPNEREVQPRPRGAQVAALDGTLAIADIEKNDSGEPWLRRLVRLSGKSKNTFTSIELRPSFVLFSYVKDAVKEDYAEKANDSRRKAQTDCQVYTERNSGRGNKSPETPFFPPKKSYGTRQVEQNEHDQDWE
jgi:hypothetical protein